jgi:hypothetical protein
MDSPAGEETSFPDLVVAGGGGRCPPPFPLAPRRSASDHRLHGCLLPRHLLPSTHSAPHEMSKTRGQKDPVFAVKSLRKGRGKSR